MDTALCLEVLKASFSPYIKDIQDFHFYYDNPLFWTFFMVLFLVLEIGRSWNEGKAFFFCAIISSVLLGATRIEGPLIKIFTIKGYQGGFDPFILKMAVFIVIAVVIIYFVFIDDS